MVLLQLETVRPLKQGAAGIDTMNVRLEGQPVPGGWAFSEAEAQFVFKVLGKRIRRTSTYRYTNFERVTD